MKFFILAAIIACALADKVPFKDCGSKTGNITSVDVSNCPAFPCPLVKGTNVTVAVVFTPSVVSTSATASVHGIIARVPIAFPIPQTDGCKTGVTCPTVSGTEQTYKNQIYVSKLYPQVSVVVKWELADDKGNDLFCFVVPAEIKSA
ncbi:NPC intracellular cholesterol transporter 2-like [Lineus longissimus]|uniref:NPC intracellular cholesterol transporter 2-like n=1 Tax=Lineus longissimus TaxID=88925 RepID=UPI002B4DFEE0